MSANELLRIEDLSAWDRLLSRSPHATRFLERSFLDLFEVETRFYGVFRKGICTLGLPIIDCQKYGGRSLPQCYYQGPVFYDEIYRAQPFKRVQAEIELAEFAGTELAKVEPYFTMSLHPSLKDIRGYDWVHFHDPDKPRVQVFPRYTARFFLEGRDKKAIRMAGRSARRQEEGYAHKRENLTGSQTDDFGVLFALYEETFARQGQDVSSAEKALLKKYVAYFMSLGIGRILTTVDGSGTVVSAAFVFEDYDGVWHVPLIGTSESRYGGTLLYYHVLDVALDNGAKVVDFNGANSPNRSYFKHSIGADPELYFDLVYDNRAGSDA